MPTSNHSGSDVDHSVPPPPLPAPPVDAKALAMVSGAAAGGGAAMMFMGCSIGDLPLLICAGFLLSMMGMLGVLLSVPRIRTVGGDSKCPPEGGKIRLKAMGYSPCPEVWPTGSRVCFWDAESGELLAESDPVPHPKALVSLFPPGQAPRGLQAASEHKVYFFEPS